MTKTVATDRVIIVGAGLGALYAALKLAPRPVLMRFTIKLLAHLYDTKDGDWMDKVIHSLTTVVPAA